jgi:hypothetical protein
MCRTLNSRTISLDYDNRVAAYIFFFVLTYIYGISLESQDSYEKFQSYRD